MAACSNNSPDWHYVRADSSEPRFSCAKLYLEPENVFKDLGLEILFNSLQGYSMFVNIHGRPLQSDSEGLASAAIEINGQQEIASGFVLQGSQRMLLPYDVTQKIIQALLLEDSVTLKLDSYTCKINGRGFPKKYEKLQRLAKKFEKANKKAQDS